MSILSFGDLWRDLASDAVAITFAIQGVRDPSYAQLLWQGCQVL